MHQPAPPTEVPCPICQSAAVTSVPCPACGKTSEAYCRLCGGTRYVTKTVRHLWLDRKSSGEYSAAVTKREKEDE